MLARLRDVVTDGSAVVVPAARWRRVASLLLALAGLGVYVYLTVDHFAKIKLVCAESGVVNCQKVTTSAQSHFLGIPVAVLGLAFYVAMTALNLPAAWRAADRRVHLARLALALVGIVFVLYLVAAELLIIGNICLWCTSVHVITFLLLVLLVSTVPPMLGWGTAPPAPPSRQRDRAGAGAGGRGSAPGQGQGRAAGTSSAPSAPATPTTPGRPGRPGTPRMGKARSRSGSGGSGGPGGRTRR